VIRIAQIGLYSAVIP